MAKIGTEQAAMAGAIAFSVAAALVGALHKQDVLDEWTINHLRKLLARQLAAMPEDFEQLRKNVGLLASLLEQPS